jgi:hypothetical protein
MEEVMKRSVTDETEYDKHLDIVRFKMFISLVGEKGKCYIYSTKVIP